MIVFIRFSAVAVLERFMILFSLNAQVNCSDIFVNKHNIYICILLLIYLLTCYNHIRRRER